ncbi:hypothetical protein [[Clostridium] fimetarium]|uniref:Uncharacterized protein n=1 Tax=[Clostridium] fimetarium TaxID=99656 RepID=A0A1I0QSS8_9FIRM|nr:hypothetical protein [[Clostridium] fimetarium]SEW30614.1 hypothetical protein SAMN05421659_10969 [[Clostridium] fimetarium]
MNEKDKKKNNEYFTDEDYLDMAGTSSASECTGLIPQGSNETDSASQYNDLYQFGIPHVAAKAAGEASGKTSTSASDRLSSNALTGGSDKFSSNASNGGSGKLSSNTSNSSSDNASSKSSNTSSYHSPSTHI